jgi:hypothetical protein
VLAIALSFLAALSWGVGRLSRGIGGEPGPPSSSRAARSRFDRAEGGAHEVLPL